MPPSLWSGNLRLSLVIIPVKLHSAVSTENAVAFRQIHAPSGTPIRHLKGIITEQGFEEVDEDDIAAWLNLLDVSVSWQLPGSDRAPPLVEPEPCASSL